MAVNSVNNVNNTNNVNNEKKTYEKETCPICKGKGCPQCQKVGLKAVNINDQDKVQKTTAGDKDKILAEVRQLLDEKGKIQYKNVKGLRFNELAELLKASGHNVELGKVGKEQAITVDGVTIADTNGDGVLEVKELKVSDNLQAFAKELNAAGVGNKAVDKIAEAKDVNQAKTIKDEAVAAKNIKLEPLQEKVEQLREQLSGAKFKSFKQKDDLAAQKEVSGLASQLRLAESELTIAKIKS